MKQTKFSILCKIHQKTVTKGLYNRDRKNDREEKLWLKISAILRIKTKMEFRMRRKIDMGLIKLLWTIGKVRKKIKKSIKRTKKAFRRKRNVLVKKGIKIMRQRQQLARKRAIIKKRFRRKLCG